MFSKALFKQSCKANGVMWSIITVAVCFMLACVMLISGSGNIADVKNAVEDTIIVETINSQMQKQSLTFYDRANDGAKYFDNSFVLEFEKEYKSNISKANEYQNKTDAWIASMPNASSYDDLTQYQAAMLAWKANTPSFDENSVEKYHIYLISQWLEKAPQQSSFTKVEDYQAAVTAWMAQKPNAAYSTYVYITQDLITNVYTNAVSDVQAYALNIAKGMDEANDENSQAYKEIIGSMLFSINPGNQFSDMYEQYEAGSAPKEDYDVTSLVTNITVSDLAKWNNNEEASDIVAYINSDERNEYRIERTQYGTSILIAGSLTSESTKATMISLLKDYGVDEAKYDSFGYTYESVKHMCKTSIISFQSRYDYELSLIDRSTFESEAAYQEAVAKAVASLKSDLTDGLLDSLPEEVSSAIAEIGQMDLYGLIVGSIFFKMAGLLLPIIYIIMSSNNLVSGQVDSGSMAYVLSTSTKRQQVTFTQACYLILSLFAMILCTTITSCICFAFIDKANTSLTYGKLILLNLGAFLTLFAISGINFLTSCWFDRNKRSMALGGGISMFFLVATMLGLFGSQVIPSVVRLDALNYFNYFSIISLFDSVSILDGTCTFIWKLAILFVIGAVGYVVGAIRFKKKDLPL